MIADTLPPIRCYPVHPTVRVSALNALTMIVLGVAASIPQSPNGGKVVLMPS